MNLIDKRLRIGGMTCINCQDKIERALNGMAGVEKASVSWQNGTAQIRFDVDTVSLSDIKLRIESLDYEVLPDDKSDSTDLSRVISLLAIIIALYVLLQQFGILNLLVPSQLADSGMGYGALFIVGLLTSVHCIAMCGGINLSQCLPQSSVTDKPAFLPSAMYNLGRVTSYTVIGFILGFIGSLLGGSGAGIPVLLQGILKLIAGAFMVIMGINMLGIFPWLRKLNLRPPKFIAKKVGLKKLTERRPFFVGLLNGLMPCGPLQSMQILALASGNPLTGALSMLMFSLGTMPLMLGLGTIISALGKKFAHAVMNVGAVLVAVLGLAMLSQGGALSGMLLPDRLLFIVIGLSVIGVAASLPIKKNAFRIACVAVSVVIVAAAGIVWQGVDRKTPISQGSTVQIIDGVQMVESTLSSGQYPTILVQAGMPVRWNIYAPNGSINGCNYRVIISEYGIVHEFTEGENIIEFTPAESGEFSYTCWMGMIRGNIIVS